MRRTEFGLGAGYAHRRATGIGEAYVARTDQLALLAFDLDVMAFEIDRFRFDLFGQVGLASGFNNASALGQLGVAARL